MSAQEIKTPVADFVRRYAQSDISRLHMPGHKGRGPLGCEPLDITEIAGADELYEAGGIIAQSELNAARLFGTAATYYSTEGSSQCIRAMLFLAMQAAPQSARRPVLLAARNAHKALIYAAALLDFDISWLWPEQSESELCSCAVSGGSLAAALQELAQRGETPFGVYVTSPDYLGGMQDISALAEVCRGFNVPLLVDNAHGAYLHFLPRGSRHPIALGAAMCCDSAHKTLPVLTGGAYLHLGQNAPIKDESAVRGALALFGSTSPSYLILQSLDECNARLAGDFAQELEKHIDITAKLAAELNAAGCKGRLLLTGGLREPLKLTLDAAVLGCTGQQLAELLRAGKIECEYSGPRYVVLMPSVQSTGQDYARLRAVLAGAVIAASSAPELPRDDGAGEFASLRRQTRQRCTIRQAMFAPAERVPAELALGRVCAMPTVSCPPAVPIAVSGEEFGSAALDLLNRYGVGKVSVVKEK